jgi:peptide/nickel transport system permease protein
VVDEALRLTENQGAPRSLRGPWRRAFHRLRRQPVSIAAFVLLVAIVGAGVLAPVLAPYAFNALPPGITAQPPSWHHLFGTDLLGRDNFSRVLYGIRTSVSVAFSVALAGTALGVLVGSIGGYFGGWLDATLTPLVDFTVAIPVLALLFTAIVFFGSPTPAKIGIVLALVLWTGVARVVRATIVSLRGNEYVEAARAAGASSLRIIARHVLPNALGPILAAATVLFGQAILLDATVEFLDYGYDSSVTPSLGNILADTTKYGLQNGSTFWWLYIPPSLVIVAILVCVNLLGDGIDEALNPADVRGRV